MNNKPINPIPWITSIALHALLLFFVFPQPESITIPTSSSNYHVPVHLMVKNTFTSTPPAPPIEKQGTPPVVPPTKKQPQAKTLPIPTNPEPAKTAGTQSGTGTQPGTEEKGLPGDRAEPGLGAPLSPIYPKIALNNNWEGLVKVTFQVNEQGRATNYKIVQSTGHAELDNSFINAVMTYGIFEPKKVFGRPVSGFVTLDYTFVLDEAL